jgi:hypothetical protein
MLSISTGTVPGSEVGPTAQLINMRPLLIQGVDFKCTQDFCYGIGPIHRVLINLQQQLNRIIRLPLIDGFIGVTTKTNAEWAAVVILNLRDEAGSRALELGLNFGQAPLQVLRALANAALSMAQITALTVPLTQLFRIGANALAAY